MLGSTLALTVLLGIVLEVAGAVVVVVDVEVVDVEVVVGAVVVVVVVLLCNGVVLAGSMVFVVVMEFVLGYTGLLVALGLP